ncbi:hypothetical protein K443DRAFT_154784 [Laccaria amethystina LaAM-08-1]|uniref:Major facilitator superfamily (MFS) profile domain-containing protein n=1 Tax=Laccaria amethystina LaAM-08-1 TaxID=1095629 RepID=A0A0C9XVL6_9AGAR|nr:hypothetical protein K443DRAFT_154784 [Laccaria amethystina LaAM-08-1]
MRVFPAAANLTPQILVPVAADLAPPTQRGFSFSIVLLGIILGVLLGRVIAGLIAQFLAWRVVYYTSFGLHCVVLVCFYLFFVGLPTPPGQQRLNVLRHLLDNGEVYRDRIAC